MSRYWIEGELVDGGAWLDEPPPMPPPDVDDGKDHWKHLSGLHVVELARRAIEIKEYCESPIETQLGAKLLAWLPIFFPKHEIALCRFGKQAEQPPERLLVVPQYVRGRYRFDMAVEQHRKVLVLIECDGKEFHSSEKDLARDKAKDAAAEKDGVPVFRFAGRDIFLSPDSCVSKVLFYLREVVQE